MSRQGLKPNGDPRLSPLCVRHTSTFPGRCPRKHCSLASARLLQKAHPGVGLGQGMEWT